MEVTNLHLLLFALLLDFQAHLFLLADLDCICGSHFVKEVLISLQAGSFLRRFDLVVECELLFRRKLIEPICLAHKVGVLSDQVARVVVPVAQCRVVSVTIQDRAPIIGERYLQEGELALDWLLHVERVNLLTQRLERLPVNPSVENIFFLSPHTDLLH